VKKATDKKPHVKILIGFLKTTLIISIVFFVFWMEECPINIVGIGDKLSKPHQIDLMEDILAYWWPFIVSISLYLNIIFINKVLWFFKNLNNGRIRWGGKAAND
jgi:hypothetical protein